MLGNKFRDVLIVLKSDKIVSSLPIKAAVSCFLKEIEIKLEQKRDVCDFVYNQKKNLINFYV